MIPEVKFSSSLGLKPIQFFLMQTNLGQLDYISAMYCSGSQAIRTFLSYGGLISSIHDDVPAEYNTGLQQLNQAEIVFLLYLSHFLPRSYSGILEQAQRS